MIITVIEMNLITDYELDNPFHLLQSYEDSGTKFFLLLIIYGPFIPLMIYPIIDIVTIL